MSTTYTLPHWDMSDIFPGLESNAFVEGFTRVVQDINDLAQLFDEYSIQSAGRPQGIAPTMDEPGETFERSIVGAIPCGRPAADGYPVAPLSGETLRAFETV